jgi:hypothetical protein
VRDKRAAAKWCVSCGKSQASYRRLEAAHTIGRARDERTATGWTVHPNQIVFLCASCHVLYDAHQLDLYPKLTDAELVTAAIFAAGAGAAVLRLSGPLRRNPAAAAELERRVRYLTTLELAADDRDGVGGGRRQSGDPPGDVASRPAPDQGAAVDEEQPQGPVAGS